MTPKRRQRAVRPDPPPTRHPVSADAAERATPWPGILRSKKRADGEDEHDLAPPRPGDHVWVEQGEYRGCILDLLRIELGIGGPLFVCKRSSSPYEISTSYISLYRRWPK